MLWPDKRKVKIFSTNMTETMRMWKNTAVHLVVAGLLSFFPKDSCSKLQTPLNTWGNLRESKIGQDIMWPIQHRDKSKYTKSTFLYGHLFPQTLFLQTCSKVKRGKYRKRPRTLDNLERFEHYSSQVQMIVLKKRKEQNYLHMHYTCS